MSIEILCFIYESFEKENSQKHHLKEKNGGFTMKSAVRYSLKKYTNYIGFKTMSFKIAIINISLSVVTFSLQSNRCNSKTCLPLA